MDKGFTLLELMVVTGIITLLTALTLPNYRVGDQQLALQRSIHQLAQDLRRAQEMAMSSKKIVGAPADFQGGYGVFLDEDVANQYVLFADFDNDQDYSVDEAVETVSLENRIAIYELDPADAGNSLNIVFMPPHPTVILNADPGIASAFISLKAEDLETMAYQYSYQIYSWWTTPWKTPRATGCDVSSIFPECPDTLSATEEDPSIVYDQWWFPFWPFTFSKEYHKQQTEVPVPLQKIIQVNKAGLIAIE